MVRCFEDVLGGVRSLCQSEADGGIHVHGNLLVGCLGGSLEEGIRAENRQHPPTSEAVRIPPRHLNRIAAPLVGHQMPDTAAAGTGEQSQFAVAGLAPEELQHRFRVHTRQPY
jgi:hypothetical protein